MAYNKDNARALQKAASDKYENQVHAVRLQIPVDVWPMVEQYAKQRGLTVGACIKACLQECMQRDGYGKIVTNIRQAKQANKQRNNNDQSVSPALDQIGE